MSNLDILGVRIDGVTLNQAVVAIENAIKQKQPSQVVTVNPEFVMLAQKDDQFKQLINTSYLALADGIGLIWAAEYLARRPRSSAPGLISLEAVARALWVGLLVVAWPSARTQVPERVTGVDLSYQLAILSANKPYSLFLLGEKDGIGQLVKRRLEQQIPGVRISGTFAGDGSLSGDEQTHQAVAAAAAQVVLVAYGAPKQEYWIKRHLPTLPSTVAIGVGGTFRYLSGQSRRAPRWIQVIGGEWLYRLLLEPWRWRRQRALPAFVVAVIRQYVQQYCRQAS
jgi:N-acetylglucosaminyldiphosphoundecaprenol N-acetyl-beta-D-mannosaminyltransferase